PFGGLMIWKFGDFRQLAPVGDKAFYEEGFYQDAHLRGRTVFNSFQRYIELKQCHRQSGQDSENFRNILNHIAEGTVTVDDYNLLMTRRKSNLTAEEIESFQGAIRLYFENEEANKANNAMLKALNLPVA